MTSEASGACLLGVDVKKSLLLVAWNKIKPIYPWNCFSNFASSQKHFNLRGETPHPKADFRFLLNESLRREVVLKAKVETGCSMDCCVLWEARHTSQTGIRLWGWSARGTGHNPAAVFSRSIRGHCDHSGEKRWGKENNHRKISPFPNCWSWHSLCKGLGDWVKEMKGLRSTNC